MKFIFKDVICEVIHLPLKIPIGDQQEHLVKYAIFLAQMRPLTERRAVHPALVPAPDR
jgi:hypothetical protein